MRAHLHRVHVHTVVAGAAALALIVMGVGCGGSTSDSKEAAPSAVEAPPSATPLSVEWTDADLEKTAERIGYGAKPAAMLARNAAGVLVFTPQTDRDHVATKFRPLSAHDGERSLELVLDVKQSGGEACAANLQDQAYHLLASVPCKETGEQKATAKVPAGVTGVRVYFQSPKREPLSLPARMRLVEHR